VINKYGASLLALVAQHFKVPFYVVADSTKWIQISRTEFILEEMPLAEINDPINAPTSSFIHTHNVYFDTSPLDTVTAHTSEYGIEEQ
jgi:translation initiation factor 2B subunit (eIF-2B alpha/beta/delta family)